MCVIGFADLVIPLIRLIRVIRGLLFKIEHRIKVAGSIVGIWSSTGRLVPALFVYPGALPPGYFE